MQNISLNIFDLIQHYYGLRKFEKVDACSLKTHPSLTFLNQTDNGIQL